MFSCKEYYEAVAPWVEVDARVELFGKDVADELLEGLFTISLYSAVVLTFPLLQETPTM